MGGYLTNDEVEERFFALNCLYPSLLSSNVSIGTTRQDRHIYRYVLGGHGHETARSVCGLVCGACVAL